MISDRNSYMSEFQKQKAIRPGKGGTAPEVTHQKLLTDRSAYICYLEQQLERTASSNAMVHSFHDRLEEVSGIAMTLQVDRYVVLSGQP